MQSEQREWPLKKSWIPSCNLTLAPCCLCNKCETNHKHGEGFHVYCEYHATQVPEPTPKKTLAERLKDFSMKRIYEKCTTAKEQWDSKDDTYFPDIAKECLAFVNEVIDECNGFGGSRIDQQELKGRLRERAGLDG